MLDSLLTAEHVVEELRFWVDTLEVLDRLAQDDIAYARKLVGRVRNTR